MAKKNIGATLSIKDGNFTTGIRNAITGTKNLKTHTANATGSLKKMGTQGNSTGQSLASLAKKAVGVVAAYAGFRQIVKFGQECIEAANAQTKAETRLEQLMMNVKGTTLANVDAIKKYSSTLQGLTTVGDEVSMVGASQLATFQMQSSSIQTLMPALNDLAVATYGVNVSQDQMQQSANLLGKVMMGQTGALTRVGVTFDATQAKILKTGTESEKAAMLVEILGQNFGGLAERMANTPEGRIIQIKNAWGDMKEVIGGKLYPVVTAFFGMIATKMPAIQTGLVNAIDAVSVPLVWVKDNILPPIITAFKNVWTFGVSAFDNIKAAVEQNRGKFENIKGVIDGVKTALKNAFELCKPAINYIKDVALPRVVNVLAGVVTAASGVVTFFVNNWGWIAPIIAGIAGALLVYKGAVLAINVVQNAWAIVQGICTVAQWALNVALTANPIGIIIVAIGALIAIGVAMWMNWDSICAWCKQAWTDVCNWFVSVGTAIGDFFSGLWAGISNTVSSVWNSITGFLSNAWNTISSAAIGVFTGIGNAIANVWNGIVGAIKGAINAVIGAINGMIRGAVSGVNGLINGINSVTGAVGIPAIPTFTAPQIPMLAEGGIIRKAGTVLVGEKGAELLNLPGGASVTPLDKSTRNENRIEINVYANGKSSDEIIDEVVPKLKLALANL